MKHPPLIIDYFSDVLCIWAYAAQARVDELRRQFGGAIDIRLRFIPVFGDTAGRIGEGWRDRGGFAGFSAHVQEVAAQFEHIQIHPQLWEQSQPASCANAHLYLKAVECWRHDIIDQAAWAIRLAFFRDGRDIAELDTLFALGAQLDIPAKPIEQSINNGQAMAALCRDVEARDRYRIEGSPTFLLNKGRQKLYGNLGYRVIEANVQELLKQPDTGQASWC